MPHDLRCKSVKVDWLERPLSCPAFERAARICDARKGLCISGLPPLFIGEIALLSGFVVLLRTGCLVAEPSTVPNLLLTSDDGMDGFYAHCLSLSPTAPMHCAIASSLCTVFALIVIALLLEDARRTSLRYYGAFSSTAAACHRASVSMVCRYQPNDASLRLVDHVRYRQLCGAPMRSLAAGPVVYLMMIAILVVLALPLVATPAAGGVANEPCPPGAIAVEPGASIQIAVDRAG